MNPCDIPVTPKWVNDTIWYQIFPDRFCNGDHSIDLIMLFRGETGERSKMRSASAETSQESFKSLIT